MSKATKNGNGTNGKGTAKLGNATSPKVLTALKAITWKAPAGGGRFKAITKIDDESWICEAARRVANKNADTLRRAVSQSLARVFGAGVMGVLVDGNDAIVYRRALRKGTAKKSGKARKGGAAPYGWEYKDGEMVPCTSEQEVVNLAQKLAARGLSVLQVAASLNDGGLKPRRGQRWYYNTTRALLSAKVAK